MKKSLLLLLIMFGFLSNAQNSFIYKKTGEKLTIMDWPWYPNGPKSKFPYYLDDKPKWTKDQREHTEFADLMPMKEIDSITSHGITFKPYTLVGEKYIFLASAVAQSKDYTLLLGFHRRGSQLQNRSFNFKFVDNKTNKVIEDYIYKDYAGEGELAEQQKVFASAVKYFGNCADFMKAVQECKSAVENAKEYADKFKFSFLYRSFKCE